MGNQKSPISDDGRFIGQWSEPCLVGHSHGLRSSEGAVRLVVPQVQSTLFLVVGPIRVANDFQSKAAPRTIVPVSQGFADDNLKAGTVAPFDGVRILANDAFENTPVILVAAEPRRFGVVRDRRVRLVMVLVFQPEEPAPCFAILCNHLLGGGRTNYAFVFTFESACVGVLHIALKAIFIVVPHEALEVDFVPESGGSVQQFP